MAYIPSLDPFRADDSRDFEVGLCARLFLNTKMEFRDLRTRMATAPPEWYDDIDPGIAEAFVQRVESFQVTLDFIAKAYDHVFHLAFKLRQQHHLDEVRKETFLSRYHERLVFAGSDEVPTSWSSLGWIDDNPDSPLAFSRDSGHLLLVAGAQGGGKTVLSTLIGQDSQQAQSPLTAEKMLPTAYAFFHIEEQDRLPQLLDGLKKNPGRRTWTCSSVAWGWTVSASTACGWPSR